jgi:hypothetical protein
LFIAISGGAGEEGVLGLYHSVVAQAIAEPPKPPKSCVTPPGGQFAAPEPTKTLCMAGKRFDLAGCHAIDRRQPYRWARFAGAAIASPTKPLIPKVYRGERAAEWSW